MPGGVAGVQPITAAPYADCLLDEPGPRRAGDGTATANTFGRPRCKKCAGEAGKGAEEPGWEILNIARTHRKLQVAILGNCRPGSSAASPALPAQFLHLGHPNVFAVAVPSPARLGPGSSNNRIDRGKRDLSLFVQARSILIRWAAPFRYRGSRQ